MNLYNCDFYIHRIKKGLPVDKKNCIYTIDYLKDTKLIKKNMMDNPFEKFERKRFFYFSKDLNIIAFNSILWNMMTEQDKVEIKKRSPLKKGGRFFYVYTFKIFFTSFRILRP